MKQERLEALTSTVGVSGMCGVVFVSFMVGPLMPGWASLFLAVASFAPFGALAGSLCVLWYRLRGEPQPSLTVAATFLAGLQSAAFLLVAGLLLFGEPFCAGALGPMVVGAAVSAAATRRLYQRVLRLEERARRDAEAAALEDRAHEQELRRQRGQAEALALLARTAARVPEARREFFRALREEALGRRSPFAGLPAGLHDLMAWAALAGDLDLYRAGVELHHQWYAWRLRDSTRGSTGDDAVEEEPSERTALWLRGEVEAALEKSAPLGVRIVEEALAALEAAAQPLRLAEAQRADAARARRREAEQQAAAEAERQRQTAEAERRRRWEERQRLRASLRVLTTPAAEQAGDWASGRRRRASSAAALRLVREGPAPG